MCKKTFPLYYAGVKQDYAKCVVVGDLIFISGSSGRTIETGEIVSLDVREQTLVAYEKIRLALEEAGSSLKNLVKIVYYLTDIRDYDAVRETERKYYGKYAPELLEEPPALTDVQVVSLWKPNMYIMIDAIACKSK